MQNLDISKYLFINGGNNMKVSRELALELFNLSENFSEDDLKKKYTQLAKITHSDMGGDEYLFNFIVCCKDILEKAITASNVKHSNNNGYNTSNTNDSPAKKYNISIYNLFSLMRYGYCRYNINDINKILATAKISIRPIFKGKSFEQSIELNLSQPFYKFLIDGNCTFNQAFSFNQEFFKRFKHFKVRVEFMDDIFKFKISPKKLSHIVKYENFYFDSVIKFTFK